MSKRWTPSWVRATSLLVLLGLAAPAQASEFVDWFQKEVLDRLDVSGYRYLGYHAHEVTGDRDAFGSATYFGLGDERFTDVGSVRVEGRQVLGVLDFQINAQTNRFNDPQADRITLRYDRGPWDISIGDVRGRLNNTNEFARFVKTLDGVQLAYRSGPFEARALRSEARGATRTVTLQGLNSPGPYYLQSSQIVRGSEQIQIDGVPQVRGVDYVINYEAGSITFQSPDGLDSTIIPPTSTIVATYEAFSFGGGGGTIEGASVSYDAGGLGRVGLTAMRQTTGSTDALSSRSEFFQGFGAVTTPYFLQFEPLPSAPIVIRLNGRLLSPVEFRFDEENSSIFYILIPTNASDTIEVTYTPIPTNTVDGDRETLGFDWRVPLGGDPRNFVQYSQALGKLDNPVNPTEGVARGLQGRYESGDWTFDGSVRDVPAGFVTVETVGFQRNERAHRLETTWRADPALTIGATHQNRSVISRSTNAEGEAQFRSIRFTDSSIRAVSSDVGGQPWQLQFGSTRSSDRGEETRVDTWSAATPFEAGKLQGRTSLIRQNASGLASDGEASSATLNTFAVNGTYDLGQAWTASADVGLSLVDRDGESGDGRDITLQLTYSPNSRLTTTFRHLDSDSGAVATLGSFSTGWGAGFGDSGFSGGVGNTQSLSASQIRDTRLSASYQLSDGIFLTGNLGRSRSTGSFSANAETDTASIGLTWDVAEGVNLNGSLNWFDTRYLETPTNAESLNVALFGNAAPPGPWSLTAGVIASQNGGNSGFASNSWNADVGIGYRIDGRQSLGAIWRGGASTGFFAQTESAASLTYSYRIWQGLTLNATYSDRTVSNTDPSLVGGAFGSRGFDVQLAFTFGR